MNSVDLWYLFWCDVAEKASDSTVFWATLGGQWSLAVWFDAFTPNWWSGIWSSIDQSVSFCTIGYCLASLSTCANAKENMTDCLFQRKEWGSLLAQTTLRYRCKWWNVCNIFYRSYLNRKMFYYYVKQFINIWMFLKVTSYALIQ